MLLLYSLGSQPVACTHRHTDTHTDIQAVLASKETNDENEVA